jgi:hypothetical protein
MLLFRTLGPAAGPERGFEAQAFGGALRPALVAKRGSAVDAAPRRGQFRVGQCGIDAAPPGTSRTSAAVYLLSRICTISATFLDFSSTSYLKILLPAWYI